MTASEQRELQGWRHLGEKLRANYNLRNKPPRELAQLLTECETMEATSRKESLIKQAFGQEAS